MAMHNQFQLIGNLSKAPRLEKSGNTDVCLMQLAVTTHYFDKTENTQKEITEFHFIRTYGVKATNANKFLIRGQQISVSGHIKSWYDKDKNEGGMYLVCDEVLYGRKPNSATNEQTQEETQGKASDDEEFNRMYEENYGKV